METFLTIMQIIALAAVTVLCIYLVVVLIRVRNILTVVEQDVKMVSTRVIPVLENLEVITDKVKNVTQTIEEQVDVVKDSIHSVKEIAQNIVDFERRVQARIEEPVMDTVGTIAAVFRGVQTFVARLRGA